MCIILRLICEVLSWIAVDIRFLWDYKHGVYGAGSFIAIVTSWYLRKDMIKFNSAILYMNIIFITRWLFDANFEILHCSGAFARCHKHCKPDCSFMQARVDFFCRENMTSFLNYVTAMLRTLYVWRGSYNFPRTSYCKATSIHQSFVGLIEKQFRLVDWWCLSVSSSVYLKNIWAT